MVVERSNPNPEILGSILNHAHIIQNITTVQLMYGWILTQANGGTCCKMLIYKKLMQYADLD